MIPPKIYYPVWMRIIANLPCSSLSQLSRDMNVTYQCISRTINLLEKWGFCITSRETRLRVVKLTVDGELLKIHILKMSSFLRENGVEIKTRRNYL